MAPKGTGMSCWTARYSLRIVPEDLKLPSAPDGQNQETHHADTRTASVVLRSAPVTFGTSAVLTHTHTHTHSTKTKH